MATIESPFLNIVELADFLRIHRVTVYRLIKNGQIPCFRVAHDWRFDRREIEAWMESGRCDKGQTLRSLEKLERAHAGNEG